MNQIYEYPSRDSIQCGAPKPSLELRREGDRRSEGNRLRLTSGCRRGWKLGGEGFLDWILDKIEVPTKEAHPSRERDETEQAKALRIVQEELKRREETAVSLR